MPHSNYVSLHIFLFKILSFLCTQKSNGGRKWASVSPTNISKIENGKQAANLDTLYRIAYALDAKIDIIPV